MVLSELSVMLKMKLFQDFQMLTCLVPSSVQTETNALEEKHNQEVVPVLRRHSH